MCGSAGPLLFFVDPGRRLGCSSGENVADHRPATATASFGSVLVAFHVLFWGNEGANENLRIHVWREVES
jgi:hypothetical protein